MPTRASARRSTSRARARPRRGGLGSIRPGSGSVMRAGDGRSERTPRVLLALELLLELLVVELLVVLLDQLQDALDGLGGTRRVAARGLAARHELEVVGRLAAGDLGGFLGERQ